jgi:hypothetical protein
LHCHTRRPQHLIVAVHLQFCTEARPEASEEVDFATDVPGEELLHESGGSNDSVCSVTDHNEEDDEMIINDESLGTKSKSENSIRKRKLSDFSGEFMAGDKVRFFCNGLCNLTFNCFGVLLIFKISTFCGIL